MTKPKQRHNLHIIVDYDVYRAARLRSASEGVTLGQVVEKALRKAVAYELAQMHTVKEGSAG